MKTAAKPRRRAAPRHPAHDAGTRDRILEAAGEVFAAEGFRRATVREIRARAKVNIAAINYHFGDKYELYREVFSHFARAGIEQYPVTFDPGGKPEPQLRAFCRNFTRRLLDPGRPAWHGRLIAREMVEPTPLLDEIVKSFMRPQWETILRIVAANVGAPPGSELARRCATSLIGQMLFQHNCRAVIDRVQPGQEYTPEENDRRAAFVAEFSLAALRALRGAAKRKAVAR